MAENTSLAIVPPVLDPTVLEQKVTAWSKFGKDAYSLELVLSGLCSVSIADKIPTKIEDIPNAELFLKELKAKQAQAKDIRLKGTQKLTDWGKKMITFEQSLDEPISQLSNAMLQIKKADEARIAKENADLEELKIFKQNAIKEYEQVSANMLTSINNLIANSFNYALDNPPAKLEEYLTVVKNRMPLTSFTPNVITHPDEKKQAILTEVWSAWKPEHYLNTFHTKLTERYSDFDLQLSQKEEAKKKNLDELKSNNENVQQEAEMNTAASSLTIASTPVVTSTTKALKKTYAVDMEDNEANMLAIVKAFFGLYNKVKDKIKVKLYFNLKVEQMAKALGDLKTEDNSLEIEGITFKPVDKL